MSSELTFGLFCLVFVVGTFWLSAVFEGRRRDREQKTQQILEEASDPRAVVRVLASVRLQASWFMKMLLWVLLIMLALILYATIQLRISGVPLDTGDWVSAGLLIVFTPGAVWGLWVCRVSYREILPEKLIRVTNRGRKLTLHYWQIDSSYFTLLGDENGLFELTDTTGIVHRFKPHVEPCRYLGSQVAFRLDYGYWADPNNSEDAQVLVRFMQDKYWVQRLLEVPVVSGLALDGVGLEYRPVGGPEFGPEFRSRQSVSGDFTWAKNFVLT
ncbi:hypothetical protein [Rothia dentocariosa]|uniref:hypothetical protein n=1 Tax=Rothia dentocariosa TaxID=2047 RepID=UPI00287FFF1A|nr:hypothetical protein [Rothia dentocariosa]